MCVLGRLCDVLYVCDFNDWDVWESMGCHSCLGIVQSHSKSSRTPAGGVTQKRYAGCIIMNRYSATRDISYVGFWCNWGVEIHVHNITSAMCFLCNGTSLGARNFGMRLYGYFFHICTAQLDLTR